MSLTLKSAGLSDVGCLREHNEDNFRVMDEARLFIVADGMGGHRAGDVASDLACKAIEEFFGTTQDEDITWPFQFDQKLSLIENRMMSSIKLANKRIFDASRQRTEHYGMGTTVVCLAFDKDFRRAIIAHVGDSRCYRVRSDAIELMTYDHSLVNDYIRAMPDILPEQLVDLPRNVITRALGMQDDVRVDLQVVDPILSGDLFILCSDGLNSMISDDEIMNGSVSFRNNPEALVQGLVQKAKDAGGEDNVTVIAVEVEADASDDPAPTIEG